MNASVEMPRYKCHKEVHALTIQSVVDNPNGSIDIFFKEDGYEPINLEGDVAARFKIREGDDMGFYVVYEDDYVSWSPTDAFLNGYSEL